MAMKHIYLASVQYLPTDGSISEASPRVLLANQVSRFLQLQQH